MIKNLDFSLVNSWMKSYVDKHKFVGCSALVAVEEDLVYKNHCGLRKKNGIDPFDFDTVGRIYSMTKPITSFALMILEDQGKVDLNTPLSEFLPSFRKCMALKEGATSIDEIEEVPCPTLMHLLTHTSGLSYAFNDTLVGNAYASAMRAENETIDKRGSLPKEEKFDLQKFCDRLSQLPLSFHPGRKWEYSMSIDVIGRVIEIVSGKDLATFFQDNIFNPMEMNSTGFFTHNDMGERLADCYAMKSESKNYQEYLSKPEDYQKEKVDLFLGGSGLLSTIYDYFNFTKVISGNGFFNKTRIISPFGIQKLTTNMLQTDIASIGPKNFAHMTTVGMGHGLGGSVIIKPQKEFSSSVGDYSWGGMASTYFWIDKVNKMTTIFFTQLIPSDSYPNRPELKKLVRDSLKIR